MHHAVLGSALNSRKRLASLAQKILQRQSILRLFGIVVVGLTGYLWPSHCKKYQNQDDELRSHSFRYLFGLGFNLYIYVS